jgi:hypothetical protein
MFTAMDSNKLTYKIFVHIGKKSEVGLEEAKVRPVQNMLLFK